MLLIAYCSDATVDPGLRQELLTPHMQHLRAAVERFCLAAPLATADGSAISGDPRLIASIFALDVPTVAAGREIMEADPYFTGGVWSGIAYFEISEAIGAWVTQEPAAEESVPTTSLSRYLALAQERPPRTTIKSPLLDGKLSLAGNAGLAPPSGKWKHLLAFQARNLAEAKALFAGSDPAGTLEHIILAVPFAGGRWIASADA